MNAALADYMMKYFSADESEIVDDRVRNTVISVCKKLDSKLISIKTIIAKFSSGSRPKVLITYGRESLLIYFSIPKDRVYTYDDFTKALIADALIEARSKYYFTSLMLLTIALIILSNIIMPSLLTLVLMVGIGIALLMLSFLIARRAPKHTYIQKIDVLHKHMISTSSLYRLLYEKIKLVIKTFIDVFKDVEKGKEKGYAIFENYGLFMYAVKKRNDVIEIKFAKVLTH